MPEALLEQIPCESGRTLWDDVVQCGYEMAALTAGNLAALAPALDAVWAVTSWEGPAEA